MVGFKQGKLGGTSFRLRTQQEQGWVAGGNLEQLGTEGGGQCGCWAEPDLYCEPKESQEGHSQNSMLRGVLAARHK